MVLISKTNERQISSEELIKYAHKISSSHAVAAPYNWEVGDPRRPYPTDFEMRGCLMSSLQDGNMLTLLQQQHHQQQNTYGNQQLQQQQTELPRPSSTASTSSSSSFAWQSDIKPNIISNSLPHHGLDVKNVSKDNVDDVEVMSTDSSSSSSSDSQ